MNQIKTNASGQDEAGQEPQLLPMRLYLGNQGIPPMPKYETAKEWSARTGISYNFKQEAK